LLDTSVTHYHKSATGRFATSFCKAETLGDAATITVLAALLRRGMWCLLRWGNPPVAVRLLAGRNPRLHSGWSMVAGSMRGSIQTRSGGVHKHGVQRESLWPDGGSRRAGTTATSYWIPS